MERDDINTLICDVKKSFPQLQFSMDISQECSVIHVRGGSRGPSKTAAIFDIHSRLTRTKEYSHCNHVCMFLSLDHCRNWLERYNTTTAYAENLPLRFNVSCTIPDMEYRVTSEYEGGPYLGLNRVVPTPIVYCGPNGNRTVFYKYTPKGGGSLNEEQPHIIYVLGGKFYKHLDWALGKLKDRTRLIIYEDDG